MSASGRGRCRSSRSNSRTGDYVVNGQFSLADIVMALSTHRWMTMPFDKPKLPAVDAHYARMQARPAGNPGWARLRTVTAMGD